MNTWPIVEEWFHQLESLSPKERADRLANSQLSSAIRYEVATLLEALDNAGSFLEDEFEDDQSVTHLTVKFSIIS